MRPGGGFTTLEIGMKEEKNSPKRVQSGYNAAYTHEYEWIVK